MIDMIVQGEERAPKKVLKKNGLPIGWRGNLWKGIYGDPAVRHYYKNSVTVASVVILVPDSDWKQKYHWFKKRVEIKMKIKPVVLLLARPCPRLELVFPWTATWCHLC